MREGETGGGRLLNSSCLCPYESAVTDKADIYIAFRGSKKGEDVYRERSSAAAVSPGEDKDVLRLQKSDSLSTTSRRRGLVHFPAEKNEEKLPSLLPRNPLRNSHAFNCRLELPLCFFVTHSRNANMISAPLSGCQTRPFLYTREVRCCENILLSLSMHIYVYTIFVLLLSQSLALQETNFPLEKSECAKKREVQRKAAAAA